MEYIDKSPLHVCSENNNLLDTCPKYVHRKFQDFRPIRTTVVAFFLIILNIVFGQTWVICEFETVSNFHVFFLALKTIAFSQLQTSHHVKTERMRHCYEQYVKVICIRNVNP